ncbi:hypothetical protein [Kineococcus radiotolerans]|uniref:Uncharacterized protein n=1 Tax=Kineococcus radiotolerans (strain ATCC BAA-149 / DSM 14245 / SRS30216) TaxID=266940 RepID=A6WH56_KINRD|nr:hypothetical protein [Kineococcus radiotolerans]ABS06145.1 hypothetical protein Krad_4687 [Kineococcus radiotolerans SRS30216 = ATCC BAA-149]
MTSPLIDTLAGLDDADLDALDRAVYAEQARRLDTKLGQLVRTAVAASTPVQAHLLARPGTSATRVTFWTTEWDNGHFYDRNGHVQFSDGTALGPVDLGEALDEPLATKAKYDSAGEPDGLVIDL